MRDVYVVSGHPDRALGEALRRLREERGMAQEEVAFAAGLSTNAISRIERGLNSPLLVTVKQIAEALDMSLGEFVAELEREEAA
jgi:transcriptional regulator with XRE-family HTH domain